MPEDEDDLKLRALSCFPQNGKEVLLLQFGRSLFLRMELEKGMTLQEFEGKVQNSLLIPIYREYYNDAHRKNYSQDNTEKGDK